MSEFRKFIIRTAEIFVVIVVVLMTLAFAVQGYAVGAFAGGAGLGLVTFLLGGLFGFVLSSLLAATFFLLAEIAENTRRA